MFMLNKYAAWLNQFSSVAQSCPTFCDPMNHSTPGLPVHYQLLESTQTQAHWVHDAIQPSHPLLSPSSPALNLSQHQGLSIESALRIRWPKYWSFSFSISLSNEYSGLVQLSPPYMTTGYMTAGKTIALTRWTFVSQVMSLLFNMLFRLVIIFLPRSKHLLISWL